MTLRARIVLSSAAVLLVLFALAVGGIATISGTVRGRAYIRDFLVSAVKTQVHGKLYVGSITSGFLTGVTVDSLEIRDPHDSLFAAAGAVSISYDLRDIMDRRFVIHVASAQHPVVYIRQHENGTWNFSEVFPSSPPQRLAPRQRPPLLEIDSAVVRDGAFTLTLPWHPSPKLRGARLDSAVRFELTRKDHEIRRTNLHGKPGYARTWRWHGVNLTVLHGRISNPDTAGMAFTFANASVAESDPPFVFHNVRGAMHQLGDSIWVDVPHLDLPGSTGRGAGKIVWGSDLPVRYDIRVHADSASLADIAWVYPTLPTKGGGSSDLHILTEPRDMRMTDFALTNLDVRSTRSHLLGAMTFVTGAETLAVRDVALRAAPVNFDLLRTLNGKPFPYDWQGDLTGTVRASGGYLGKFKVEDAKVRFDDAHVPGATTIASGHGELDIFAPAFTAFHELAVNVETLDLRTLQYLNKNFPRLGGTVSGTAVLDSSWLDVRFHDATIVHHDGPGPESRASGRGRVTWGNYLTYDLDLQTAPLAFATLRRSYPALPIRTSLSGPLRVTGQSPDLHVTTSLSGPGGTLTYDGQVDADPPSYGARGTGTVSALDLRELLGIATLPTSAVGGSYAINVSGDSLADLTGTGSLALGRSRVASATILPSRAIVHFGGGRVTIDTLDLAAAGLTAHATGTVGLAPGIAGSLTYEIAVTDPAAAGALADLPIPTDTGRITVRGALTGAMNSLATSGTIDVARAGSRHGSVVGADGTYSVRGISNGALEGTATLGLDSLTVAGITVPRGNVSVRSTGANAASFVARFQGESDRYATAGGFIRHAGDTLDVRVDSARLSLDSLDDYRLGAPSHILARTNAVTVDSLLLTRAGGGAVAIRDAAFIGDSIRGSLRTSGVTLGVLRLVTPSAADVSGDLTANVALSGTTAKPRLDGSLTIAHGRLRFAPVGLRVDALDADIALLGDSIAIRRLAAVGPGARPGRVDASGAIAFSTLADPSFDLRATARNFRAIDKRGLATLDVTTTTPLTLTGSYKAAIVSGAVRVDRGTVYIPELIRKRIVDLNDPELRDVVDTTVSAERTILPAPPGDFARGLRLENVAITVGDDVWLRSAEANIKLGGALNVGLGRDPVSDRARLALDGALNAVRGTYRLDVVPFVQPTFDVEQGTLRFYGTPDLNPTLEITAINTVHRPRESVNGQDVRIRASIGGTLAQPTLTLSSADNLPLSQSDLLSYLITGEPAFTLEYTTSQYINQLANVAVRSAGNILTSAIPRSLFDVVELQTPFVLTPEQAGSGTSSPSLYGNLLSTRALLGKQINRNLFLNFSTGFCAENFRNAQSFRYNLGLQLEYRFARTYTAQFGVEPGTSYLVCARSNAAEAIQQTPPQIGIDFFRAWRF